MATEDAARAMEAWAKRRMRTFQDAERGLCFGRLTLDESRGRSTSAAAGCTTTSTRCSSSTGRRPRRARSTRRRRATRSASRSGAATGRRAGGSSDISDEALDGSAVEGAAVSDFLLEELERRREGQMRDIVATIQSDQYRLITAEPDGALVVQGGPGTGKTAVGLHRASWLLFTHREQLRRGAHRRAEPDVHGLRLARAAGARRGGGRAARRLGAARRDRGRTRGGAGRRAAEGRHAARRRRPPRGRARREAGAGGARALRGRLVRLREGA